MIRIALAQQDFPVGDMAGNLARIEAGIAQAREAEADLVLFPEMAISGYPPEDLLLRPGFMYRCHDVVNELVGKVHGIDVVVGHPWMEDRKRYNAVSWIRDGQVLGRYFKQALPNYKVFDEQRYFTEGSEPLVVEVKGSRLGVLICEDAWVSGPAMQAKAAGAELLLLPNASPYCDSKLEQRLETLQERLDDCGLPVVYSNLVGGQDELVFDGRSMLMSSNGSFSMRHEPCEEAMLVAEFDPASGRLKFEGDQSPGLDARQILEGEDPTACIYAVLVRGLHDYISKNGFSDVVIGLSGGIDSALTLALAVDALGAEHVHAAMMPSRHTTELSVDLAREQAELLGVEYREISIEPSYQALLDAMQPSFEGLAAGITEENIQARIRGAMLMALSNKFGWLVLATGNKSELAVGYSTIYGDMCGGFSPIKDCMKTRVYALSHYRNTLSPAIPQAVIERLPSAELAPDQFDQDSLPPYEVLDQILIRYIEQDWSIAKIVLDGFEEPVVRRVAGLVIGNEYKRRQGASGVRITSRAFGRDRRYPITSGWHEESIKEI
jgi:NAD+ synthase (glutamine-hydrolysing)